RNNPYGKLSLTKRNGRYTISKFIEPHPYGFKVEAWLGFPFKHPTGTLIKTSTSPDIYLVENGKKRYVSWTAWLGNTFFGKNVISVSQAEMEAYPQGRPIGWPDNNYASNSLKDPADMLFKIYWQGSTVWLWDSSKGRKRKFALKQVFESWGYSDSEVKTIYPWQFPANQNQGEEVYFRDGTLIKGTNAPVYVIENGKARWIKTYEIFVALGYQNSNIINLPQYCIDQKIGFESFGEMLTSENIWQKGKIIAPGHLAVNSNPPGAEVYEEIAGRYFRWPNNQTLTPTGEYPLAPGTYNFVIKKSGYQDNSFTESIISGNAKVADIDLKPLSPAFLSVSPASLDFGTSANQKSFDISSNTNWSISDNRNWISCTPTSGSGNKTINVSVDRSGLSAGTHSGKITISSSNAGTKTVNVNLVKEETPPSNNFCLALEAEDMSATTGAVWGDYRIIWSNGEIYKKVDFPQSQTYEFEVKAKGDYAHGAWPNMELRIDNSVKGSKAVSSNNWNDYTLLVNVPAGSHKVAIAFTNDYYDPGQEDRNLYVDRIKISSSGSNPPPPPPTNNNLIVNGDFSQGRNSWQLEVHPGCAAGWRIKNNALKINVDRLTSGASSHPYRVQVKQVVTQLKPNTHYKLSFKYKGTIPWLAVTISKNQPDWTDVGFYKTINVSSSWRTREFSFKTKPDVISNNKLNFQIGSGLGEFWLDEVVLEEETSSNPSPSPPPLNLILVNEDFNNGLGVFKKEIHIYQNADIYQQGGNAVIKVKKAGNFYEVQLKTFIPTETGRKYALEFKAKADRSRKIYLQLSKDTSPWTYYGFWQEVKLSTSWQTYSYEFTSNHTDNRARLTFHAGAEIGKVYLDYVKIKKISLSRPNLITETEINPKEFFLFQNYPNPFNASTAVKFTLAQAQHITLAIFNILGKKVITLVDKELEPGNYQVSWNGKDDQGNEMASGIYLCLLQAGKWVKVKKMTLLR
ncbi:hypothetical protein DRQ11_11365, partial [candidate division KSB1 bacterium]